EAGGGGGCCACARARCAFGGRGGCREGKGPASERGNAGRGGAIHCYAQQGACRARPPSWTWNFKPDSRHGGNGGGTDRQRLKRGRQNAATAKRPSRANG